MAMVTRTVKFVECDCIVLNPVTMTAEHETLRISARVKADKRLVGLQDLYNGPVRMVVSIASTRDTEVLFGMDEVDFLKYAKELPARNA